MRWISTRGASPPVTFRTALLEGMAPDGGLYLPERLDPLSPDRIEQLSGAPLTEVGAAIAAHLIGDEIPYAALTTLIDDALNFPIPLVRVSDDTFALELFHGPTFAFKDVGARVMARLMAYFADARDPLTVLVATSGDTGSAVAQAFAGVAGTRVVVLFPEGQVSDVQEAQFTTIGGNVLAIAVAGTFDDCQALVKQAFADAALRRDAGLTSANSINVGRLLPQSFYYAWAAFELRRQSRRLKPDRDTYVGAGSTRPATRTGTIVSVPSGNFGNLTGGLIARRLGFPIDSFIAATNVNDVVPEYLATGIYRPRPSLRTVANAMDVGAPSNFERIRSLAGDSVDRLRIELRGAAFDDATVRAAIAEVHAKYGYVLDPHSAIAWLGLGGTPGILLATAHPAKFREVVEPAIGASVPLPASLSDALARPRFVTRIPADYASLAEMLR